MASSYGHASAWRRLFLTSGCRAANFPPMPSRAIRSVHKSLLIAAFLVTPVLLSACGKPAPRKVLLSDGTQIILLNGTRAVPAAGFPQNREIRLVGNGQV